MVFMHGNFHKPRREMESTAFIRYTKWQGSGKQENYCLKLKTISPPLQQPLQTVA